MSSVEDKLPGEGDVVAGKYRVEGILGRGGMGLVVAATHTLLDQKVAIKFLTAEAQGELLARFGREARAVAKLKSEHVARVFDVGELDDGVSYMVMEYLDGKDLADIAKIRGALPVQEAVYYILQACHAIAEAHTAGIVHRDLKPSNLFLIAAPDGSPCIKVLDFGISKDTSLEPMSEEQGELTKTSMVLGTPYYMSPEQMRSARSVDARADVWSLGAILYQLLTKARPFKAASFPELVVKVLQDEPAPPTTRRSDLPPGLAVAIMRCLQKSPDDRYASVAELGAAIAPFGPPEARPLAERVMRMAARSTSVSLVPVSRSSLPPDSEDVTTAMDSGASSSGTPFDAIRPAPSAVGFAPTLPSVPDAPPKIHSSAPPSTLTAASAEIDPALLEEPDGNKRTIKILGAVAVAAAIAGVGLGLMNRDGEATAGPTAPAATTELSEPEAEPSAETTADPQEDPATEPSSSASTEPAGNPTPRSPSNPRDPASPEPATPEPATPEPATPEPATPEPATPEPATPQPPKPQPPKPQPPKPQPPQPQPLAPTPTPPPKPNNPLDMKIK